MNAIRIMVITIVIVAATNGKELSAKLNFICESINCTEAVLVIDLGPDTQWKVPLQRNMNLVSPRVRTLTTTNDCYYNQKDGHEWASISNCNNLIDGNFNLNGLEYEIKYENQEYVLKENLNEINNNFCSAIDLQIEKHYEPIDANTMGRQSGNLAVELLIINDDVLLKNRFNGDKEAAIMYNKKIVNGMNSHYQKLKITITLTDVRIWTRAQVQLPRGKDVNMTQFTMVFMEKWYTVQNQFNPSDYDAVAFFTGIITPEPDLNNPRYVHNNPIGLAFVGGACTADNAMVIMQGIDDNPFVRWDIIGTFSHELGHLIGLKHIDPRQCTDCQDTCVMNWRATSKLFDHWSECSLQELPKLLNSRSKRCLRQFKNDPKYPGDPATGIIPINGGGQPDGEPGTGSNQPPRVKLSNRSESFWRMDNYWVWVIVVSIVSIILILIFLCTCKRKKSTATSTQRKGCCRWTKRPK